MPREALDEAVARCQAFEGMFSRTIATSDVGRINAAAGEPTQVQPETAELISKALEYCAASDGLFDITIGAVSELWDFHEGIVPTDEAIQAALLHIGWQGVHVDVATSTVTLDDPDARLDLGGIAKGYISDVIIDQLAVAGVESGFVNLGGNVAVLGPKLDGSPWTVGVRNPFPGQGQDATSKSVVATIECTGGSVVTSGLYERSFTKDGRTYWHILDPRTGYPVETDLASATVYAPLSIDGDGLTKPLFMLGNTAALDYVTSIEVLQVMEEVVKGGTTMVMVTHNEEITRMADRVVRMRDGRMHEVTINRRPAHATDLVW